MDAQLKANVITAVGLVLVGLALIAIYYGPSGWAR